MLKVYCNADVAAEIRKLASAQGVSYSSFLAPFLQFIAKEQLVLAPFLQFIAKGVPTKAQQGPTRILKVYCNPEVEAGIRKLASAQGVPYSNFLAPFLQFIAKGQLVLAPHFPPPAQQKKAA